MTRTDQIKKILVELDPKLRDKYMNSLINPSFASGHTGIAMFYAYYYKLTRNEEHLNTCISLINRLIDHLADNEVKYTFSNGLAGIGWALQHFAEEKIIEVDDSIFSDFDSILSKIGYYEMARGNYDYLHGALGCGMYLLSREKNAHNWKDILSAIKQSSHEHETGTYWIDKSTPKEDQDQRTTVNLGLSHGQPSIIFFLAKLTEKTYNDPLIVDLLRKAVEYVMESSNVRTYDNFFFPTYQYVDSNEPMNMSRLAWCYGDLGVLLALYQASLALKDKKLEAIILDMAIRTTGRKSYEETHINDGGLCHGYAGVAHIYNRLFRYTSNDIFLDTSNYWVDQLINHINEIGGIEFFNEYHKGEGYQLSSGFLTGSAGAGLSLITALDPSIEPNWDRFLLLS